MLDTHEHEQGTSQDEYDMLVRRGRAAFARYDRHATERQAREARARYLGVLLGLLTQKIKTWTGTRPWVVIFCSSSATTQPMVSVRDGQGSVDAQG